MQLVHHGRSEACAASKPVIIGVKMQLADGHSLKLCCANAASFVCLGPISAYVCKCIGYIGRQNKDVKTLSCDIPSVPHSIQMISLRVAKKHLSLACFERPCADRDRHRLPLPV